jgi:hypothetical protein
VYWGHTTPSVDVVALNVSWSWAVISKCLLSLARNARVLSGTVKRHCLLQFCFLQGNPSHQILTHRWAILNDFYCCFPHSLKVGGSLQLYSTFSHSKFIIWLSWDFLFISVHVVIGKWRSNQEVTLYTLVWKVLAFNRSRVISCPAISHEFEVNSGTTQWNRSGSVPSRFLYTQYLWSSFNRIKH